MIYNVDYPLSVLSGIRKNDRAFNPARLKIFGADTETVHGVPYTLQAHDGKETFIKYVTARTIWPEFLGWIVPRMDAGGVNVCYFHNLRFDLRVLFFSRLRKLYDSNGEFDFTWHGARVTGVYGRVNFAQVSVESGKSRKILHILDSALFTAASFDESLRIFGVDGVKLPLPAGLGDKRLKSVEFEAYAKNDAIQQWKLAKKIMEFHERYGVRVSVSLSQFATRVFRHHFLRKKDHIPFPPKGCVKAAELSYHGGKNDFRLGRPSVVKNCSEADVNSCFVWAMSKLPGFLKGRYEWVNSYERGVHGIFLISGTVPVGRVVLWTHDFKPIHGPFEDIWVTSYELDEIFRQDLLSRWTCRQGWIWRDASPRNPWREYAEHFYGLKEKSGKQDPSYAFYKLMGNGVYGKTVGKVEEIEESISETPARGYVYDAVRGVFLDRERGFRAMNFYNPFIGSLITGRSRALMLSLETRYDSFHTATDSIKTSREVEPKPGLGGWKLEVKGDCWLFRNKLYLHYDEAGKLKKWATHGFKGGVKLLEERRDDLMRHHHLAYAYKHVVGLREGFRRRETPGDFVNRQDVLCVCRGGRCNGKTCHCA